MKMPHKVIGERVKCPVCKIEFLRRKKGMKQRRYSTPMRPYFAITCSKKCSKIYSKIYIRKYLKNKRTSIKLEKNGKN